jgi:hypothetical protein
MVFVEVLFQSLVVHVVLWRGASSTSVTQMTSFMLFTAMCKELVVAVESLSTETTFWVAFEPALINGARIVIAKFLMPLQFLVGEQLMLVGEDLLVPRTQVAHDFLVNTPYMAM